MQIQHNSAISGILMKIISPILVAMLVVCAGHEVRADAQTVRMSYQFGLGFLPILVVLDQHLIEKNAAKLGLQDVTAAGTQLSGAAISNDALLSGNIDVASGGIGGLLQLWDRTNGRVKGIIALNNMALVLNSNDPNIKTVKDYVGVTNHKIALPAVKVGLHAIVLQMASDQLLGRGQQSALDNLTLALPHPEAYLALVSGRNEIRSHFTS